MPVANKTLALAECAREFGVGQEEVGAAMVKMGLIKRATKGMRVDEAHLHRLREHFNARRKSTAAGVPRNRKLGGSIDVAQRPQRSRGLGGFGNKLAARKAAMAAAKSETEEVAVAVEPEAEVAPVAPPPKTVKLKKGGGDRADEGGGGEVVEVADVAVAVRPAVRPPVAKRSSRSRSRKRPARAVRSDGVVVDVGGEEKVVKAAVESGSGEVVGGVVAVESSAGAAVVADVAAAVAAVAADAVDVADAAGVAGMSGVGETDGGGAEKRVRRRRGKVADSAADGGGGEKKAVAGGGVGKGKAEKLGLVKSAAPKSGPEAASAASVTSVVPSPANERLRQMEALLNKQGEHQAQQAQKAQEIKRAAEEKKAKQDELKSAARKPAAALGAKITLDKPAAEALKKRRKKGITRSEAREKTSENRHTFTKPTAPVVREVQIPEAITVEKLANETALKSSVIIRKVMDLGMSVTANEVLDRETAWIIVEELGHTPVDAPVDDAEKDLLHRDDSEAALKPRPPVVTVMGHVDHGKTSLLDHIRKTRVASGEAGGITQHIGAYSVSTSIGRVTFLDTPGHELFSQMRARGAKVTDLVVLVVAADDGVKPQTIEAINHAKAANVPMIVAANKMDKPEADLDKVKRELSTHDVLPEDWGGDVMIVPVSAETGEGVERLLEALAMQTELLELAAPVEAPATGVVIEARVDKGRGIVATLVVARGTLRRGDSFLCGTGSGRVRAMWDAETPKLEAAYPSMPVEMQGLSSIPEAGAELIVVEDERAARDVAAARNDRSRMAKMASRRLSGGGGDAAALLDAAGGDERKDLNVVIKADVEGSREALVAAFSAIGGKKAGARVIHSAVGAVTESDIYLAQTGSGLIVGFNVRPDSRARKLAESRGVKIIVGGVVYELVEKVREAVLGMLAPTVEETVVGTARVRQVFNISRVGNIAGCLVEEGVAQIRAPARLVRDGVCVYEGAVSSLYHFKDQVAEVRTGSECGIGISRFNDIKAGDVIEVLRRTEIAPEM